MTEPILVTDIGGTNARFALAYIEHGSVSLFLQETKIFRAEHFKIINGAANAILAAVDVKPKVACLAVVGPINGEVVEFTNFPWALNIESVKAALSLKQF